MLDAVEKIAHSTCIFFSINKFLVICLQPCSEMSAFKDRFLLICLALKQHTSHVNESSVDLCFFQARRAALTKFSLLKIMVKKRRSVPAFLTLEWDAGGVLSN